MALKVGELYASFGIDSKGISKDISGIEKQCSSIGKSLAITGAALTASVTRPIVNTAKDIVKTGASFDGQMSRVKAIAQATDAEFETLRNTALEWAGKTKFTAQETGEAMEYMGMAGWKADQMVAGLPAILALAAASGEDLGTTSDIVTDGLTAFGLKAEDASRFADVLAAASVNANTNVSMMGESFKFVGPLAGSMGYSIEDTAVALGLMANSGIKATMAGTSLRNIIQNMQTPTKSQAEAMKKLGLSLTDAKGGTKSLMKVMKEMRQSAKKAGIDTVKLHDEIKKYDEMLNKGTISEEEYDAKLSEMTKGAGDFMAAVSDLAGARGLSGMLAIMNSSDEDFDKFVAAIRDSDGEAQRLMGEMLDNLEGDMIIFDSALNTLKIRLYDLFSDDLRNVVQEATKYVDAFSNMDSETQKLVVELGALAAAAGPAVAAIGGLIAGLPKVAPALKAIISPAGIAAGSLALFAIAAVDADNKVGQAFDDFATKAAASLESSQADIESYISTVSGRIPALADSITSGLGKLIPAVVGVTGSIVSSFIGVVSDNADDVSQIGAQLVTDLVDSIASEIEEHDMIAETATMLTNLSIAFIKNTPKIFNAGIRLGSAIIRGIKNTNWGQLAVDLGNAIVEAAGEVDLPALEGLATDIVDAISAGMDTKNFQGIRTFIGNLAQKIADFDWNEVADKVEKIATDLITAIGNGITTAGDNAGTIIEAIGNILTGNFGTSFIPAATKIAISVIQGIADQIPKLVRTAGKIITSLGDLIKDIPWSEAGTAVGEIATSLVDELVKTINSEDFDVAGIISGLGDALIAAATGLATAAGSLITKLVEYLTNEENLKSIGDAADKVLSGFAKGIADVIPGFGENAEIIKAAIEGIGVSLLVLKGAAMVSNIASIISGIGTSFGGLLGAINPVGLAISLVASTILYFWNTSEEFRDAIIAIWEGIKSGIKDSIEGITGFFKDLAEATKTAIAFLKDPNGMWDQMQAQMNGNMTYNPNIVFNPNFIVPADDEAFDNKMNDVLASMFSENGKQDMTVSFGLDYDPSKNDSNLESEVQKTAQEIVDSATKTDFTGKQGELDALMAKYAELETKASESMTQVQTTATESMQAISSETENATSEFSTALDTMNQSSQEAISAMTTAIANGKSEIEAATLDLQDAAVQQALATMSAENGEKIGTDWVAAMAAAIGAGDLATPADTVSTAAKNAASSVLSASAGTTIGEHFARGIAIGIENNESIITRAARVVAREAYNAARRELDEHSPSRLAEKGIGKMFDAGIAVGIDKNLGMLEDAASRVSDVLMGQQYVAEPSRNTVYTARQSALETEQAIVRAASSKAFRSNANGGDQRMMHVILELDGETVAETIVPIVDDTMMADMKTSNRR